MKALIAAAAVAALAGCMSAPQVDFSHADAQCSARCSTQYNECTSGFKLFPLVAQAHCNESLKVCAASCGATVVKD
ncbi:hypothetical protein PTKU15_10780 [Paraburkholderia terrae]|nr:hypothetical protein PTKU15_10780 [Paraburkholderia terrae]